MSFKLTFWRDFSVVLPHHALKCLVPAVWSAVSAACDRVFLLVSRQKPGMDVADGYVTFVRHSQDMLREKVNEEVYTERLFEVRFFPKFCPNQTAAAPEAT